MPKANFKRLSGKLTQLCKHYGLTQVELAKRLGMQPSHLNIYLRGRSDIHSQRLIQLLEEIGISVEDQVDRALERFVQPAEKEEDRLAVAFRRMSRAERESLSLIISRLGRERARARK